MAAFLWSWLFIFPLLVQPGYAQRDVQNTDANVPRNPSIVEYFARSFSSPPNAKRDSSVAIALGVIGGVALLAALTIFLLYLRNRRKRAMNQIEDGIGVTNSVSNSNSNSTPKSLSDEKQQQWWHIDLNSAKGTNWWVLDTKGHPGPPEGERKNSADEFQHLMNPIKASSKSSSHLDRLRYFLSRKDAADQSSTKSLWLQKDLPVPPIRDRSNPITRPPPVLAPTNRPRYPSILDRPGNPPGFPPPSPYKNANLARVVLAADAREKNNRRRVQVSPNTLLPIGQSTIPGGPGQPARPARPPPDPAPSRRRRSWLSRHSFKNPFLPSDAVLPSSVSAGLAMRQQLLHSPRSRSKLVAPATSPLKVSRTGSVKRVPVPIYEERGAVPSPMGARAPPGTGGVPRPRYQEDRRVLKSAQPLGYHSRLPAVPKPL